MHRIFQIVPVQLPVGKNKLIWHWETGKRKSWFYFRLYKCFSNYIKKTAKHWSSFTEIVEHFFSFCFFLRHKIRTRCLKSNCCENIKTSLGFAEYLMTFYFIYHQSSKKNSKAKPLTTKTLSTFSFYLLLVFISLVGIKGCLLWHAKHNAPLKEHTGRHWIRERL